MRRIIFNKLMVIAILFFLLIISISTAYGLTKQIKNNDIKNDILYFVEKGPIQESILYKDGTIIQIQTEAVSHLMIGSNSIGLTIEALEDIILSSRELFDKNSKKHIGANYSGKRGLDIIFFVSNPPSEAETALENVAQYIENIFSDSITVTINVGFSPMSPGILGGTTSYYALDSWENTLSGLIYDMDGDDFIQNWLPTGNAIPVRYSGSSSMITDEDRCYVTKANYNAAIGTITGIAASMTFNSNFQWDWDPSDGISSGTYCFQSVASHELGHALGFTSGVDFRTNDIETLDLYRFQKSDGIGDYNPDTLEEFQTEARLVSWNSPNNDHISDIISVEYEMSDGDNYQASHFRQNWVNAIMQPAFSSGSTFYPDFYKIPDITMFDAIGWDYNENANIPPTCIISADPISGYAPLLTVFNISANDIDGSIASWELDTNNDETAEYYGTGDPPSTQEHIYINPGDYTAELTVWDDIGATDLDTQYIHVTDSNNPPNKPNKPTGPTSSLEVNELGQYSTSTTDPDGDNVQYRFDWNADGSHDYSIWTDLVNSGTSIYKSHSWNNSGTFIIKAQARDEYNKTSSWSNGLTVIVSDSNINPYTPSNPYPVDGATNVGINSILSWTGGDPDVDDTVTYDVYFGSMPPLQIVSSNQSETEFNPGGLFNDITYFWSVVAWNNNGAKSTGPSWHFTTSSESNNTPPNTPLINGIISGKAGNTYDYTIISEDPEGDMVSYFIDWGDNSTYDWTNLMSSGEFYNVSYSWEERGTYILKVKAKDEFFLESEWSTLEISMPKIQIFNLKEFFIRIFENHPYLFPILRQILGL